MHMHKAMEMFLYMSLLVMFLKVSFMENHIWKVDMYGIIFILRLRIITPMVPVIILALCIRTSRFVPYKGWMTIQTQLKHKICWCTKSIMILRVLLLIQLLEVDKATFDRYNLLDKS